MDLSAWSYCWGLRRTSSIEDESSMTADSLTMALVDSESALHSRHGESVPSYLNRRLSGRQLFSFDNEQALGWNRAGTLNLNIRYGRMSLALFAQAASHMLRQRLPAPFADWDAPHLAKDFFRALEGDIRVHHDTVCVTLYNCPLSQTFKQHYTNLPAKLPAEGVCPSVPWLYNFKLDFRFK